MDKPPSRLDLLSGRGAMTTPAVSATAILIAPVIKATFIHSGYWEDIGLRSRACLLRRPVSHYTQIDKLSVAATRQKHSRPISKALTYTNDLPIGYQSPIPVGGSSSKGQKRSKITGKIAFVFALSTGFYQFGVRSRPHSQGRALRWIASP